MHILLFYKSLETADGWLKDAETCFLGADDSAYEVRWFGAKIPCVKKALDVAVETMGKGNVGDTWD